MTHEVFTIVAAVRPDSADCLRHLLKAINENPAANALLPFGKLPMLHFASFVVFHDPVQGDGGQPPPVLPDQLVFESCIDGPFDEYANALLHVGGAGLHRIFSCCADYEISNHSDNTLDASATSLTEDQLRVLREYLRSRYRKPNLLHIGSPGLRVDHIKAGARLRKHLDHELDVVVAHGRATERPLDLMRWLRDRLNVPPSRLSHWLLADPNPDQVESRRFPWFADQQSHFASRVRHWGIFLSLVVLAVVVAGFLLVYLWRLDGARGVLLAALAVIVAMFLFWRWLTRGKPLKPETPAQKAEVRAIKELEDKGIQNKMASLVILKEGWLTAFVTRAVLSFFNVLYRTVFTDLTPGRLAGLHTIHFGHWTLLDLETVDRRRQKAVMFLSNYDGSWETYLDDFLDNLYRGVVMIWGGGVGFPKPLDGPIFKSWARTRMAVWHAWYQAYPTLTVANIDNNDQIRKGLLNLPETDDAARLWLSRFGSLKNGNEHIEAPGDALETHDIQGMVLSGYAHLKFARYVLLQVNDGAVIRRWLDALLPHITDARPIARGRQPAFNVAFTRTGLAAIGVEPGTLDKFSIPFHEGLAPGQHHRSRALGDIDGNSPTCWNWGGEKGHTVDLLLMVYADDEVVLEREVAAWVKRACTNNAATPVVDPLAGHLMPDGESPAGRTLYREHFGFADGISQPEIEGTHRASNRVKASGSMHLVKPGEFLLGYTDGSGAVAPGIPIDPAFDAGNWLPSAGAEAPGFRDFGRNGTYLVFRQLEQDVSGFRTFVNSAAGAEGSPQDADELAARLVGRRHDGTPLAAGASEGGRANEFGFSSDPHGFACPIGAHIRRANPRDSLLDDPAAALKSANRHRLLRRGRPYGEPIDPAAAAPHGERGMLFICLSGNIERQFEFVQQNWINNTVFSGLGCEQDGLVGAPGGNPGCFTTQSPTVRQRTLKIPSFVKVKGGAYFFLPGLSALRYLARLTDASDAIVSRPIAQPAPLPALIGSQPTFLRRVLEGVEGRLPRISLAWAARYPLLMAVVLVLWPFAAARKPTVFGSHFLVGWWGLAAVSLLASLAAFVVMISLRLVLLYGWRSRRVRPQWTGSARWLHVLGFQALGLPLVAAAIRSSAFDAAAVMGVSFWSVVFSYAGAAVLGAVAALVLLTIASSAQALRPGSRPDLFFPPNPLSKRLGGAGALRSRLKRPAEWLSRLARWIVRSVPQEIGIGYIDYRNQRILPGHSFALAVGCILIAIWAVGYVTLNPAWGWAWARWGHELPALAYLIFVLILIGTLLSMMAFFFDRYGIPTFLLLAIWLAGVASIARTDHVFRVLDVVKPPPLSPAEVAAKGLAHSPGSKVIVVASEGYGLTSSAWTAEVLATLATDAGRRFTDSLRLVSTASGASVGAMYFIDAYASGGFPTTGSPQTVEPAVLERIREAAWQPSDSENAWGLVYPDLTRTFAPLVVPEFLDRGWAMEQAWRRHLSVPDATLNSWRSGVEGGWRPATAFGVTIVETGARHLFATYDTETCATPADCRDQVTHGRDLPVATAARLSSTFPFVAPVSRARVDAPAYHLSDGGFWDNYGVMAAIEWLRQADAVLTDEDVLFIEIRSSPPSRFTAPEERAWAFELIGPALAMNGVRTNAQRKRNDLEISLLEEMWSRKSRSLKRVVFDLSDPEAKLAWHIGKRDVQRIRNAWSLSPNQVARASVRQFLGVP